MGNSLACGVPLKMLQGDRSMTRRRRVWTGPRVFPYAFLFKSRIIPRLVEVVALSAMVLWIFCTDLLAVPFHPDESQWIATSNVFEAFVRGDRASPLWDESLWTLTQPPGTRYIIGVGRSSGGYGANDLNVPWAFGRDQAANMAAGAMPAPELLWWSRFPMAILGTASCLVSFYLLTTTLNRTVGYLGLLLVATNPYMHTVLRRAMAEAPLLLALLLATWIGARMLRRLPNPRTYTLLGRTRCLLPAFGLLFGMSMCVGIAGSMKLSGLTATLGVLMVWMLTSTAPLTCRPMPSHIYLVLVGSLLAVTTTSLIFVALNPYLDPDPVGRTIKLVSFRANEMQKQQVDPTFVIDDIFERAAVTYTYLFRYTTIMRFPGVGIMHAVLWLLGVLQVFKRSWDCVRKDGSCDSSIILLVMAITCAGPMLLTPLNWDRYYLLPVWFSALIIAVGMAWIGTAVSKKIRDVLATRTHVVRRAP